MADASIMTGNSRNAGFRMAPVRETKTTPITATAARAITTGRKRITGFVRVGRVSSLGAVTARSAISHVGGVSRAASTNSAVAPSFTPSTGRTLCRVDIGGKSPVDQGICRRTAPANVRLSGRRSA